MSLVRIYVDSPDAPVIVVGNFVPLVECKDSLNSLLEGIALSHKFLEVNKSIK